MSMTVTLYKNSKVNGTTRLGRWQSLPAQLNYFSNLEKTVMECQTVTLGQPIRVNLSPNEIMAYNYGSINYGNNFYYFFYITNVEMVTETISNIYYEIDAYETLVTQKPFTFGRGVIHRYSRKIGKALNPFTPTYRKLVSSSIANYGYCTLFYIRRDDTSNDTTKFGMICTSEHIDKMFDGSWFDYYQVQGTISQIVVAGVIPARTNWIIANGHTDTVYEESEITTPFIDFHLGDLGLNTTTPLINDGININVYKDQRGLDIFIPEENNSYTVVSAGLGYTVSTLKLIIRLKSNSDEIKFITVPLENVMLFTDQWQEYNFRQRSIDQDTRNLKMNTDLASGLIGSIPQAIMGAIGGGIGKVAGAGMSAKSGAGAMGGGAIFGALTNYGISAFTSPMEQELIDRQYKNANDTLSLIGDYSLYEFNCNRMGLYNYETDVTDNYRESIATGGYYVELETPNFAQYFDNGPITADVEINDIAIEVWKNQIKARFSAGVMVV